VSGACLRFGRDGQLVVGVGLGRGVGRLIRRRERQAVVRAVVRPSASGRQARLRRRAALASTLMQRLAGTGVGCLAVGARTEYAAVLSVSPRKLQPARHEHGYRGADCDVVPPKSRSCRATPARRSQRGLLRVVPAASAAAPTHPSYAKQTYPTPPSPGGATAPRTSNSTDTRPTSASHQQGSRSLPENRLRPPATRIG
jgi:hypothetical protein